MRKKPILNISKVFQFAARARYKDISIPYCHFVFQNYRIETVFSNGYSLCSVIKGSSTKVTNKKNTFLENIIYMCDRGQEVIFDNAEFFKFKEVFGKYVQANQKWLNKMYNGE